MREEMNKAPCQPQSNVSPPTLKTVKNERCFNAALTRRTVIVSLSLCNCINLDSSISCRNSALKPGTVEQTAGSQTIHKDLPLRKLYTVICVGVLPAPMFVTKMNKLLFVYE